MIITPADFVELNHWENLVGNGRHLRRKIGKNGRRTISLFLPSIEHGFSLDLKECQGCLRHLEIEAQHGAQNGQRLGRRGFGGAPQKYRSA